MASPGSLGALAAKRLGHCKGQHLSTWNVNKWPVLEAGGFRRQRLALGLCWYLGVGPAWHSDLDLPWSLQPLTLKGDGGALVRIWRCCPSTGLPPRTATSRVRGQLGPPAWGAGRPGVLSPPAPSGPIPGGGDGTNAQLLPYRAWSFPVC